MAVAYTRWLERHNQNREKMATLAVTQRRHAHMNPHAYFYKVPLTREDYLNSRMVAYPFCLYDCDIPVQGAVAIVLTTADRARDLRAAPRVPRGLRPAARLRGGRAHREPEQLHGGRPQLVAPHLGAVGLHPEGRRRGADLRRLLRLGDLRPRVLRLLQGGRGARFHPGRTHRAGRRAARSTPSAGAWAPGASTVSGTSSRARCRRRGAPGNARSRTSTSPSSARALPSCRGRPSSSSGNRTRRRLA